MCQLCDTPTPVPPWEVFLTRHILAKAEEEEARDKDFELISGTLNGAMIRIEELEEKLKKMSK